MALPQMTDEQRAEALKKAAATRAKRAEYKENIKAGKLSAKKAFEEIDDPALGKMRVKQFIAAASARFPPRSSWPRSASTSLVALPALAIVRRKPSSRFSTSSHSLIALKRAPSRGAFFADLATPYGMSVVLGRNERGCWRCRFAKRALG